jgi:hypothetical protein
MNITEAIEIAQAIPADVESLTLDQQQATLIINDQRNKNIAARQSLKETDWYVIRSQETGVAVPEDIATQRQAARDSVVDC